MLRDQGTELTDHLGMTAQSELRLDELLQRTHSQLIQTGALGLREPLGGKLGKRRTAPQRHGGLQQRRDTFKATRRQLAASLGDQPCEPK